LLLIALRFITDGADTIDHIAVSAEVEGRFLPGYSIGDNVNVRALDDTYRDWNVPNRQHHQLRLHSSPDMMGDVVKCLPNAGVWAHIRRGDNEGWVAAKYISAAR
jgi:hypothetical protein